MKESIAGGGVFERLADDSFFEEALTVLNDTVAWDVSGHYDPITCIDIDPFVAGRQKGSPTRLRMPHKSTSALELACRRARRVAQVGKRLSVDELRMNATAIKRQIPIPTHR